MIEIDPEACVYGTRSWGAAFNEESAQREREVRITKASFLRFVESNASGLLSRPWWDLLRECAAKRVAEYDPELAALMREADAAGDRVREHCRRRLEGRT